MDIDRALSGDLGLHGVRALLHGAGRRAVREELGAMAERRGLGSLRLVRVHFKPGRKLATYFRVTVAGSAAPVQVAVTWFADAAAVADPRLAATEGELRRGGVPTPFARLSGSVAGRALVTVAPLDPVFPSLATLAVPGGARALGGEAHALNGSAAQFVRYRPGQRHVLGFERDGRPGVYAKLYRPGESGPVAAAVEAFSLAARALDGVGAVRAAPPSAVARDLDALVYTALPGVPLSRLLSGRRAPALDPLRTLGLWLRGLHAQGTEQARSALPERSLEREAARAQRAFAAMEGIEPGLSARAADLVSAAAERLEAADGEPPSVVHGDMKADHILCSQAGISLLDSDSCAIADPALDLGKLLADLQWFQLLGSVHCGAVETALLDGYAPRPDRLGRARLVAVLLLAKMAGRRVSLGDRAWGTRTEAVLDRSTQLLAAADGA